MPHVPSALALVISIASPASAFSATLLLPARITVGSHLQSRATISLGEPAPREDAPITLTSSDPRRLLFSRRPDEAGAASITLTVRAGFLKSPDFWVQGRGDRGPVTYTASAPRTASVIGTVTLSRSGAILVGPLRGASFRTTPGAERTRLQVHSVRLDASSRIAEEQAVAAGLTIAVTLSSTNELAGTLVPSSLTIAGGTSRATTAFQPAAAGETNLAVSVPNGFSRPVQFASVTAIVTIPGIGVTDRVAIGKDLQLRGVASLGEAAPTGGLVLTLTSGAPEQLLLSATAEDVGSESIQISFLAGQTSATYYLQALEGSGRVTYRASAPGYRDRLGTVTLTPSGVMITPAYQGPPDEADLLRKDAPPASHVVRTSVSSGGTETLMLWLAQLDPVTKRGADITVQPLRAGAQVDVVLENTNPAVGTVRSSVTIGAGAEHAAIQFTPVKPGSTVLSIVTPTGFTAPDNATSVTIVVQP